MKTEPLYKISQAIERCFVINDELVTDTETGEVFDKSYLDNLKMTKKRKVENIACWIKNLKAEVESCKAEADMFNKRAKRAKNKIENLQNYLTFFVGGENVDTKRCQIRWRKSDSVTIVNENLIPDNFKSEVVTTKIDKMAIKKLLKQGEEVNGALLENKLNIQIK